MSIVVHAISTEVLRSKRRVLVLSEDRLSHYPEFRTFFVQTFALDAVGLDKPGYLRGPSGVDYELVFLGRSGELFPSGLEIYALIDALEPMDETAVDADLWQILCWIFGAIGGEWSVETLDATGRLYRIPAAMNA